MPLTEEWCFCRESFTGKVCWSRVGWHPGGMLESLESDTESMSRFYLFVFLSSAYHLEEAIVLGDGVVLASNYLTD